MRIRFSEGEDAARYEQAVAAIDQWWSEFERRERDLNLLFTGQKQWDLPEWMAEHLGSVDPRLMWEFGRGPGGSHRLVITPESDHHLRPLTRLVLDRAPAISGWSFTGQRQEATAETAIESASLRTEVDLKGSTFDARIGALGRVDVTIVMSDERTAKTDAARSAGFIATEYLVGEKRLNHWIGTVSVEAMPRQGLFGRSKAKAGKPLIELAAEVDRQIEEHRNTLPDRPFHQITDELTWTMWKLTPEEREDCAAKDDLFVGMSCHPQMWIAAHNDPLFCSERFSRFGEAFCYLKIDGADGLEGCEFEDRTSIEDALNETLMASELGRQIGGGTGRRYSYIDLALNELESGIELIRQRLKDSRLPERSWILFYDAELAGEWVGITPHSPPPLLTVDD